MQVWKKVVVFRKIHDEYLQMMFSTNNLISDVENLSLDEQIGYMRNMTGVVIPKAQTTASTISSLYANIMHASEP